MQNAHQMLTFIRDMANEAQADAAHWDDRMILEALNMSQNYYFMKLLMSAPDWLVVKSSALTPVAGLVSFPTGMSKPVMLEEVSDGSKIPIALTVREKELWESSTTLPYHVRRWAYYTKDGLQISDSTFTSTVYLWYVARPVSLHAGTAGAASGATALELDSDNFPSVKHDHYNGVTIQTISGTGAPNSYDVTDYAGTTRVCTTATGTFSTDTVYGTVCQLPEELWGAIQYRGAMTVLSKAGVRVNDESLQWLRRDFREMDGLASRFLQDITLDSRYVRQVE